MLIIFNASLVVVEHYDRNVEISIIIEVIHLD
jgi:hypothetical protein